MELAPIVLFVYNRPIETKATIKALQLNQLSKQSELIVFSDGAKTSSDEEKVNQVRTMIHKIDGFKSLQIIEAEKNRGLASSIINGIDEVMSNYDKVIVMEDDLIAARDYLTYMNEALMLYEKNQKIWSISGYTPKLKFPVNFKEQVYLSPRGCSWGWATWNDRWWKVDWEISDFEEFKKQSKRKKHFTKGGNDLFKLLELQVMGKIDSWAIRWIYSQFKHKMYTVYPSKSKIFNNGFNKSGTHTMGVDKRWEVDLYNEKIVFPENINLLKEITRSFKAHYDLDFIGRCGFFLRKFGGYHHFLNLKKVLRK